jgi:prepilin-type N-terminal cleavage/methylation domain-containing protein
MTTNIASTGQRDRKGLTLLELIVVIVILGVLSAIAIPTFLSTQNGARIASTTATLQAIRTNASALCLANSGPNYTSTQLESCLTAAVGETAIAAGNGVTASGSHWTLVWGPTAVATAPNIVAATPSTTDPTQVGLTALVAGDPGQAVYLLASLNPGGTNQAWSGPTCPTGADPNTSLAGKSSTPTCSTPTPPTPQAQLNLLVALADAKAAYQSHGNTYPSPPSLVNTLTRVEPSLAFTTGVSTSPPIISVFTSIDSNALVLSAYDSQTHNCWFVVDTPVATVAIPGFSMPFAAAAAPTQGAISTTTHIALLNTATGTTYGEVKANSVSSGVMIGGCGAHAPVATSGTNYGTSSSAFPNL